jgi:hypothetical protein
MQQGTTAMRRKWRIRAGIGLPVLCIALGLHGAAMARPNFRLEAANDVPKQGLVQPPRLLAGLSQDRIIAIAEKRHAGAKVVRVEEGTHKGRSIYVLRLLSKEGRVWTVRVDAETGREL